MKYDRIYIAQVQYAQCLKEYKAEVKRYLANPVNKQEHEETLHDLIVRMQHAKSVLILAQYVESAKERLAAVC